MLYYFNVEEIWYVQKEFSSLKHQNEFFYQKNVDKWKFLELTKE